MIKYVVFLLFSIGAWAQTPFDGVYLSPIYANALQINVCPDGSFKIIDKYQTNFFTSPTYNQVLFEGILEDHENPLPKGMGKYDFRVKTLTMVDTISEKQFELWYYEYGDWMLMKSPIEEDNTLLMYRRSDSMTVCF